MAKSSAGSEGTVAGASAEVEGFVRLWKGSCPCSSACAVKSSGAKRYVKPFVSDKSEAQGVSNVGRPIPVL